MTASVKYPSDFEQLILAYFDGDLNGADQRRLAEGLEHSAEARELFESYMRLEGIAVELGQARCLASSDSIGSTAPAVSQPAADDVSRAGIVAWTRRIVAGAVAVSLGVCLALLWNHPSLWNAWSSNRSSEGVGTISRIVAAEWVSQAQEIGGEVLIGTYELNEGLVELEFDSGATIILEGPAKFEVASAEKTYLHYGRARTHVPPQAYGFTIDTPSMKVVDLGTEFGLEIDSAGSAEIHVFDGEVEVYDQNEQRVQERVRLVAGQAIRVEHSGQRSEIPADGDAFVDRLTLEGRAAVYIDEMGEKLKQVDDRQAQLAKQLRKAETAARKSGNLPALKKASNEAKQRWIQHQKDHPKLQKHLARRDAARSDLNRLYREAMLQSDEGRPLLDRLSRLNLELAELKEQLAGLKPREQRSAALRTVYRQLRRVQKERNAARAEVRTYRGRLISDSAEIRRGIEQLAAARRQVERQLRNPEFDALRLDSVKRQRIYLSRQRNQLLTDDKINQLKSEQKQIRKQAGQLKRKIQQARQATTSIATLESQNFPPETDLVEP